MNRYNLKKTLSLLISLRENEKLKKTINTISRVPKQLKGMGQRFTFFFVGKKNRIRDWYKSILPKVFSIKTIISSIIALSIVAMSITASITAVEGYFDGFGYVVMVDGEEVGFIYEEDIEEINNFAEYLMAQAENNYEMEVNADQEISFFEERRPGSHMQTREIKDTLRHKLSFSAFGFILLVDGQEKVTLQSSEDFEEVVSILETAYITNKDKSEVKEITIQENIEFVKRPVSPEEIIEVEVAVNILLTGTDRRETYLVSRGDSLWSIARANSMSVSEVQEANPQLNSDLIRPGDELSLIVSEPIVNILVVEELTTTERIPFNTEYTTDSSMWKYQTRVTKEGKQGEKEVTYKITLENGKEVDREKINEKILREPTTQVVARGTANIPALGTGRFAWPLPAGQGRISSPYGWRWGRMHGGIDISAPRGTSIRAADSGVVSRSGYQGSYGNLVIINHGNGYETYYAHNTRNLVSVGQEVKKGETIALMGATGNATGSHLHFEIRYNGKTMDPLRFFSP